MTQKSVRVMERWSFPPPADDGRIPDVAQPYWCPERETMDPERRTLLQVKLEDIAACEEIFTTLMGEDVESRRKFIEENALDVKNLDI